MNTIVSAFVSNVNSRYEDSLKTYYNFGKLLLQSSVPKIIFVDQPMFDLIGENYDNTTTLIVKINAHDSYLYGYTDQLTNFGVHSANPAKDTLGFIFTMCNKTEWVKQAVHLNHFKTDNFIWVDFGIRYIFKNLENAYDENKNDQYLEYWLILFKSVFKSVFFCSINSLISFSLFKLKQIR